MLRQIKALGVGVALDDFGTGYSSLETLRAFPFDKIKLDRMFVLGTRGQPLRRPRSSAPCWRWARASAIPVLAEGIETEQQLQVLQREGCDEAQGFLLGHPHPLPVTGKSPLPTGRHVAPMIEPDRESDAA